MPNYTENRIIMEGIEDLPLYEKEQFDFNKLIPMPVCLNVTAGSSNDEDIYIYLSEFLTKNIVNDPIAKKLIASMFDKNYILTVGGRCKKLEDSVLAQHYRSGKQLVVANWGTKWNASYTSIEDGSVAFLTAWCAPKPIFKELSKRYPDKLIRVEVYDDDGGFKLRADYQGGECIKAYGVAAEKFFSESIANIIKG